MNVNKHDTTLQALCREYLSKLRSMAKKHGLLSQLNSLIDLNKSGECRATEEEVELLARAVDEERIKRTDIPNILNKSYRRCIEEGVFDNPKLKKLRSVGIYSKVSALLFNAINN